MISEELNHYLNEHSTPLSFALKHLINHADEDVEGMHMISGSHVAALLSLLVKLTQAKYIVDIGSFIGFSALAMAEAASSDARIYSCERDPRYVEVAQKNLDNHPDGYKVSLKLSEASPFIDQLKSGIELSFLDADKKPYMVYYNKLVEKTKSGGLIVIDDALWKGEVTNPQSERIKTMDQLNQFVRDDKRVENILIPLRNGVNLVYKH